MQHYDIAVLLIALKNEDLAMRNELIESGTLSDGYNAQMEGIHNRNAAKLSALIDKIGYPTVAAVGCAANQAAWLIIQHAIAQPQFMKRCATLLQQVTDNHITTTRQLAYLSDRIAVFQNEPQRYGTQYDWDAAGCMNPNVYDDLNRVNNRRKALGWNTLQEQTRVMQQQVAQENQSPPADFNVYKKTIQDWLKRTGWIN